VTAPTNAQPARELRRELKRVSASQVESFRSCRRLWYWQNVVGLRAPPRPSQELGTKVHAAIEAYLGGKEQPGAGKDAKKVAACLEAAKKILPPPGPDLLLEEPIGFPTYEGGPTMIGFVDLVNPRGLDAGVLSIDDHKTTKSFDWCKSEEELKGNVQALVYSHWGYDEGANEVFFAHNYVRTVNPLAHRVGATMPRARVESGWVGILADVRAMVELAATGPNNPIGVPGNHRHCPAYGGCWFQKEGHCTDVVPASALKRRNREESTMEKMMTLKEKLAARQAVMKMKCHCGVEMMMADLAAHQATHTPEQAGSPTSSAAPSPTEAPPKEVVSPPKKVKECNGSGYVPGGAASSTGAGFFPCPGCARCAAAKAAAGAQGVIPPDAPSRTSTPEEVAAVEAGTKKKGRKKVDAAPTTSPTPEQMAVEQERVAAEAVAQKAALDASLPTPKVVESPARARRVLLVDCFPVDLEAFRGVFGQEPVPAERWLEPLRRAVAESFGVADHGLIDFAKGKPALAAAIDEVIESCPSIVYASSYSRGYDVLVEKASARGWLVLKSVRG